MKRWKQNAALFALGGVGYTAIELAWRGYTHWTMGLTGGCVFVGLTGLRERLEGESLPVRCASGGLCITMAELLVGLTVNRAFGRRVWDYSDRPGNVLGQVCPLYALLWAGLSAPAMAAGAGLRQALQKTG